jgi:predicted AlkP superfamily pyrophosphatase or phosphodiesterase
MNMKKIIPMIVFALCLLPSLGQKPRLVVGIVVDQMRWDYLGSYRSRFSAGGFKRLMAQGFSFDDTHINYMPSVTACGHSCIYTGSVPALTGIAGNDFYINGRRTYCVEDTTVHTIGANDKTGNMSPRNLCVTTIGDELRMASGFKPKVIGVSLKDRGAILPAGHTADAAYWFDKDAGIFVSSSYYMQDLPSWVKDFNRRHRQGQDIRYTPIGNTLVADMAIETLHNEKLGMRGTTDMLTISFSSTDYVGHRYGYQSKELDEVYLALDRELARVLDALDAQVGRDNYLLFLTSDHGASANCQQAQKHGVPSGRWNVDEKRISGVKEIHEYRVYLDDKSMGDSVVAQLRKDPAVAYAFRYDGLHRQTLPEPLRVKVANGYYPGRSGDIQLILKPGHYIVDNDSYPAGSEHGSPWEYDTHIPFLLMGAGVKHGRSSEAVVVSDIAPTVCSLLDIQAPSGCVGPSRAKEVY